MTSLNRLTEFGRKAEELDAEFDPTRDGREIKTLLVEILEYLSANKDVEWRRHPSPGVPGSLSATNSRHFRVSLNSSYDLEVTWRDYPPDMGAALESFRECYSLMIQSTGKNFFPLVYLEIRQSEEKREFHPRTQWEQELLILGQSLREKLG